MIELSVVVCARNESVDIFQVLTNLRSVYPKAEIILVDNGSTDGTAEAGLLVSGVKLVFEKTAGKGAAMRSGAKLASGTWLLFHDADTEYDVRDSCAVVAKAIMEDGCCVGTRIVAYDLILISSWLANRAIQALLHYKTGIHVPDVLSGTRCMRTSVFRDLSTNSVRFGIETEITRALLRKGVPLLSAPVRFSPRNVKQGKKIRPWHLFELMAQALKN